MASKREQKEQENQSHHWKIKKCEDAENLQEVSNNAVEPTTITGINDYCLSRVFNHLNLVDLLNLADVSKRFHDAIEISLKSRHKLLRIELKDAKPGSINQLIDENERCTIIYDLTTCLKFLRCFGHKVEVMDIDYNQIAQNRCAEVDRYVNEYCAETLTLIRLYNAKPYSLNNFKEVFSKVLIVELYNCELGPQLLTKFRNNFPLAFSLSYNGVNKVTRGKYLANNIPNLTNLSVELLEKKEGRNIIGTNKIAKILRANPQIDKICIRGPGWDAKKLRSISKDLDNVLSLELHFCRDFFNLKTGTIHLKNIDCLEIVNHWTDEFPRISLSFGHLEILTITTSSKVNDNFINFVSQQHSLKKLTLALYDSADKNSIKDILINDEKLQKVLHSLEYLYSDCEFSADEIINFLNKYELLEELDVQVDANSAVDALKERLPEKWRDFEKHGNALVFSI